MAAQHILGAKSKDDLLMPPDGSLRVFPSDHPEEWLPGISPSRERSSGGETACL